MWLFFELRLWSKNSAVQIPSKLRQIWKVSLCDFHFFFQCLFSHVELKWTVITLQDSVRFSPGIFSLSVLHRTTCSHFVTGQWSWMRKVRVWRKGIHLIYYLVKDDCRQEKFGKDKCEHDSKCQTAFFCTISSTLHTGKLILTHFAWLIWKVQSEGSWLSTETKNEQHELSVASHLFNFYKKKERKRTRWWSVLCPEDVLNRDAENRDSKKLLH